jgi:hypothetical protein
VNVWPRPGYDGPCDGPLRLAWGPKDFEGQGREAYWDQTPEERTANVKVMVQDAGRSVSDTDVKNFAPVFENRAFARGWLAESYRAKTHK